MSSLLPGQTAPCQQTHRCPSGQNRRFGLPEMPQPNARNHTSTGKVFPLSHSLSSWAFSQFCKKVVLVVNKQFGDFVWPVHSGSETSPPDLLVVNPILVSKQEILHRIPNLETDHWTPHRPFRRTAFRFRCPRPPRMGRKWYFEPAFGLQRTRRQKITGLNFSATGMSNVR